jgi:hypothetical protein
MVLAFVEACLFTFVGALHFGFELDLGGTTYTAPLWYPAAIVEALLALALLLSLILPGARGIRAGRVMLAQIMVVIGVFAGQVALVRGGELMNDRIEIFYGVALVLALASIALLASPIRRRSEAR